MLVVVLLLLVKCLSWFCCCLLNACRGSVVVGSLFVMGLLLLVRLCLSHIQATKKEFKATFVVRLAGSVCARHSLRLLLVL